MKLNKIKIHDEIVETIYERRRSTTEPSFIISSPSHRREKTASW